MIRPTIAVGIPVVLLLLATFSARACETGIVIEDLWVRQPALVSGSAAGFFRMRNDCDDAVTLVSVTSPWYGRVEIHRSVNQNGNWSMQRRKSVTVQPGDAVVFQTGDLHLMLMKPESAVEEGKHLSIVFHFENGAQMAVDAEVRQR